MKTCEPASRAGEVLYGASAIASFVGVSRRQAYHLIETANLPTFKLGQIVCARPATVRKWIAERETVARSQSSASKQAA